jgi:hypothetical protein
MEVRCGTKKECNLQCIAEMFNFYFTEIIGKLVKQNNNIKLGCQAPQVINSCDETMFVYPVTENEIVEMVKKLKKLKNTRFCG